MVSDIQYHIISINEISDIFKICENISRVIYDFIPDCYKKGREKDKLDIKSNYKDIYDYLDTYKMYN